MSLPTTGWKNKGGTAERSCKCGSWKEHWLRFTGEEWPSWCSVVGCLNTAEVGAHVINPASDIEWIVPFCKDCNGQPTTTVFTLETGVNLVPANQSKTCAKQKVVK